MEKDNLNTPDGVSFGLVPAESIDTAWPRVHAWIADAFNYSVHNEMSTDELFMDLKAGRYLMMLIGDPSGQLCGVSVLGLERDRQDRPQVQLVAVGGRQVEQWFAAMLAVLVKIAAAAGAPRILAQGRPGWARLFKPLGVVHRASILTYDLSPEQMAGTQRIQGA